MENTANLKLAYIMAAQAQKHVTHNEAIRALDAVVQISVLDRNLTAPPPSPVDGDRYIVAVSATGIWSGHDLEIAAWQDNAWMFYVPNEGWLAWVGDEDTLTVWDGSGWIRAGGEDLNPTPLIGVNATADTTNRLAVSAPASLFNHAGAGHQLKLNKNAAADTASLLFQTGFSGRAEFGLAGDDDFQVKVSANGTSWTDAVRIDKDSGHVGIGTSPVTTLDVAGPVRLGTYQVATMPSASSSGAGAVVFVSDETGGSVLAFSNGTDWLRVTDRAVVS